MEALAVVFGFAVLGLLALRFGADSREGLRSHEQELAARGMTWSDLAADRQAPAHQTESLPTLAFIERALAAPRTLTTRPDAALLEARARDLTAAYWSDLVWITGVVPEPALRCVLAALDPALAGAPVVEVERPIEFAEPVEQPSPKVTSERRPQAAVAGAAVSA
jgi:hypothetical protein